MNFYGRIDEKEMTFERIFQKYKKVQNNEAYSILN